MGLIYMVKCPGCEENKERLKLGYNEHDHICLKSKNQLILEDFFSSLLVIPLLGIMFILVILACFISLFIRDD